MLPGLILIALVTLLTSELFRLTRRMPWTSNGAAIPIAFSSALAPFLFGLSVILTMALLPGASHELHLVISVLIYVIICRVSTRLIKTEKEFSFTASFPALGKTEIIFLIILSSSLILFLVNLTIPLTQNDGLEYILVGKHLYQTRDIFSYPLIDPSKNILNFYGPWTHPALYPALLYISNVLQNGTEMIGLSRLISPWFYLSSILLASATLWDKSVKYSLLCGILCLSIPLWNLGATTALIDPLTISSYILLTASLTFLNPTSRLFPIYIGLLTGVGMWSHSQTVLLPIVFAWAYLWLWSDFKSKIRNTLVSGFIATSIGGLYYIRNYFLFDSFIKDASPVNAISAFRMDEYFFVFRGYWHTLDLVRFGYFKLWNNYEAYNFTPWLFTTILIYLIIKTGRNLFSKPNSSESKKTLIILSGILLSIVLISLAGVTHYIKNERYQMIMVPLMTLSFLHFFQVYENELSRKLKSGLTLGIITVVLASLAAQILFIKSSLPPIAENQDASSFNSTTRMLAFWSKHPLDSKPLSLKAPDSLPSNQPMISHMDPAMLNFYSVTDTFDGFNWLKNNRIYYIYTPAYSQPTDYNSTLINILGNPRYTRLILDGPESQLYGINSTDNKKPRNKLDLKSSYQKKYFSLGGRKDLLNIPLPDIDLPKIFFNFREMAVSKELIYKVNHNRENTYAAQATISGFGRTTIIADFLRSGQLITRKLVSDIALIDNQKEISIFRQFFIPEKTDEIRLMYKTRGLDTVNVISSEISY